MEGTEERLLPSAGQGKHAFSALQNLGHGRGLEHLQQGKEPPGSSLAMCFHSLPRDMQASVCFACAPVTRLVYAACHS